MAGLETMTTPSPAILEATWSKVWSGFQDCLHHDLRIKHVDVSPFARQKTAPGGGRLLPNDCRILLNRLAPVHR